MLEQARDGDSPVQSRAWTTPEAGERVRENAKYAGMGLVAGVLGGLMGVGGGIVLVPLLTSFTKITQHKATGTSMAMVALTSVTTLWRYQTAGRVDWGATLAILVMAMAGASIGARACCLVPARQLRMLFGGFLMVVGLIMALTGSATGVANAAADAGVGDSVLLAVSVGGGSLLLTTKLLLSLGIGTVSGIIGGMLGIGGGPILVPAGALLLGLPQQVAQGVSAAVILPTAVSGSITHYRHGNVVLPIVVAMAITAMGGAYLGAEIANRMDPTLLRRLFGLLLLCLSLQTFWKFWGANVCECARSLLGGNA